MFFKANPFAEIDWRCHLWGVAYSSCLRTEPLPLRGEAAYKAESDLQQIVAANPQLLMRAPSSTGESLMLVRQEYPVRDLI